MPGGGGFGGGGGGGVTLTVHPGEGVKQTRCSRRRGWGRTGVEQQVKPPGGTRRVEVTDTSYTLENKPHLGFQFPIKVTINYMRHTPTLLNTDNLHYKTHEPSQQGTTGTVYYKIQVELNLSPPTNY